MKESTPAAPPKIEAFTNKGDFLDINPAGAKLTLKLGGNLILTSVLRGDGKQGITHPCSPIFGPDVNSVYGIAQHGNMRNELNEVNKGNQNEINITHEVTDEGYPKGMKVTQTIKLTEGGFSLSMTHRNTGNKAAAVNSGEHCYFDAPEGYTGTQVNNEDITELIEKNPRGTAIDLRNENTIKIPGKPELILKQKGFGKAMVWVGSDTEGKKYDQNYVCIEPMEQDPKFFGKEESLIQPGGERTAYFSLELKKQPNP